MRKLIISRKETASETVARMGVNPNAIMTVSSVESSTVATCPLGYDVRRSFTAA